MDGDSDLDLFSAVVSVHKKVISALIDQDIFTGFPHFH